jgi:biopolymer transport protein TolR
MQVTIRNNVNRKRQHLNCEINVTPFVDVMLVLLVIFMVTSPMLVTGVQVDLPKTKSSALAGQDEPISISVDKFGAVYVGEMKIKLNEVTGKLNAVSKQNKNIRIFVRGDKNVDYGKVMEVFGAIKASGYSNIALVSDLLN